MQTRWNHLALLSVSLIWATVFPNLVTATPPAGYLHAAVEAAILWTGLYPALRLIGLTAWQCWGLLAALTIVSSVLAELEGTISQQARATATVVILAAAAIGLIVQRRRHSSRT